MGQVFPTNLAENQTTRGWEKVTIKGGEQPRGGGGVVQKEKERKFKLELESVKRDFLLNFYPLNPPHVSREHCSFIHERLI